MAVAMMITSGCTTPNPGPPPTTKALQQSLTPDQALKRLEDGNARFVEGRTFHRDWREQRGQTAGAQYPFAVVLSCIDSRSSSEIVFDQGLGDIFNARVAGNIVDDELLGSMEFACGIAGARLIAVVGHTQCGAIKGACSGVQLGHVTRLLEHIRPAVEQVRAEGNAAGASDPRFVAEVGRRNVRLVLQQIRERSPVLRELIDSGKVGLVGGIQDLESGRVEFLKP